MANSWLFRALRIPSNIEGIIEEIDNIFYVLDRNGYRMALLHKVLEKICNRIDRNQVRGDLSIIMNRYRLRWSKLQADKCKMNWMAF